MHLNYINNNILISHPFYWGVYQYESKNWELYQEINNFGVGTKAKNSRNCDARYSYNNQHINYIYSLLHSLKGAGCSGFVIL